MSQENPPADNSGHALVDGIAARIRARIMSGEIPIGSQLRQAELANDFGVSRTPVREALRQLQTGGLIDVVPNRGALVRVPVPWEVREAYQVRAELEGLAAALSVDHVAKSDIERLRTANRAMYERSVAESERDDETALGSRQENDIFHSTIADLSGNFRLARSIDEINETFPRNVSAQVLTNDNRHREANFHEHERILDALGRGDAEAARAEMRDHVQKAGEQLARWYERRSSTVFNG
ncbi:GntR family transcriptional regulator [Microbacterium sp. A204]|uniref:GntR family transcriptional regulator n=1 Tax=Microbacterium sp. A204 TaxID=3457321 RepID=UPI003FD3DEC8